MGLKLRLLIRKGSIPLYLLKMLKQLALRIFFGKNQMNKLNQVKSSTYIIQQKVVLSYIFSLQKIRTEWNFKRHVFEYEENRGNDKYHFYTRLMWLNCLICWIITCVSLWESWVDFLQNNLYLILIGFWLSEKFFF